MKKVLLTMNYAATFMTEAWFETEMRTVIQLKKEGLTRAEILEKLIEENTFQMRSVDSIKARFQLVYRRVNSLDEELSNLFLQSHAYDMKAINLYTFLKIYRIPYEFFLEVIVPNSQTNQQTFVRSDFYYFFEKKEVQSEIVMKWKESTKKRLISAMLQFFRESALITQENKNTFKIAPLHMSSELKEYAEKNDRLLSLMATLK